MTDDQVRPLHRSSACTVCERMQWKMLHSLHIHMSVDICKGNNNSANYKIPSSAHMYMLCDEEVSAFNKCIHLRPTKPKQDGATYDQIEWQFCMLHGWAIFLQQAKTFASQHLTNMYAIFEIIIAICCKSVEPCGVW